MLIEHRIDDMNKGFVAVEKSVPSSQQDSLLANLRTDAR